MKRFTILLSLLSFSFIINAQNPNWLERVSPQTLVDSLPASYAYTVDINNDEYPDIALIKATGGIKGQLTLLLNIQDSNSSDPKDRIFVDITEWSNIAMRRDSTQGRVIDVAAFADIDNDGDNDCITCTYYHRWEYYLADSLDPGDRCEVMLNRGNGRFDLLWNSGMNKIGPNTGKKEGLVNAAAMSFLDYDKDGNLDLFIGSWFQDYANNIMTPSYLLRGNGDGTFSDESLYSRIKADYYPLYGSNATDINNDGWMDIATSPYCRSSGSLWENQGDGRFFDKADVYNYNTQFMDGDNGQHLCTWASQPVDYDNDGDIDFFYVLVHGGFGTNEGSSTLVLNKGEANNFELEWALDKVIRKPPRSSHLGDYDASWFDLDNDMKLDIAMGNGGYSVTNQRLYILRQDDLGRLVDITPELGIQMPGDMIYHLYSTQVFDYDLDGDDDLLIVHGDKQSSPKPIVDIYRNNIGHTKNWMGVKLFAPSDCNQSAVGSRVYVYAGGVAQMREVQAGYGHFGGQPPFIMNFGLANNNKVDSVVIEWQTNPTRKTKIVNPPINQMNIFDENGFWGDLAVEQQSANEEIMIYPNPAREKLFVKIPHSISDILSVNIYDMQGKLVYERNVYETDLPLLEINTSAFHSGPYILQLNYRNREPTSIIFMINE
jgi:hypothetical protein